MELRRAYRTQESLVTYWAEQAVALCHDIEDESLTEYEQPVRLALEALSHDRRILIIGSEKSGKSALLAHLANAPAIESHPIERHYLCWRYRCKDGDSTCSRFLPLAHLEGIELVDTASCAAPDAQQTCRALMQGADVIIAMIDARTPSESPVWELIAELPEHALDACLLAVSHTDRLGAEASLTLKDTLRELCHTRIGAALPVYFITPTAQSGMEIFRSRVQETMQAAHGVRASIRSLAERTSDLVEKQNRVLRARETVSRTDSGFIANIELQIDNFLSHQKLSLGDHQKKMNDAIMKAVPPLLGQIRSSLGLTLSPSTLLRLELMGADTDRALYERMEAEVLHLQAESDRQFALSCGTHWRSVRPSMKKTLGCEIGDFPEEKLDADLRQLRERLCRDLYEPFASTGLRHRLFRLFISHAAWMRSCVIFICFLLVVAGVFGCIGQDTLGLCCVAAALLVWIGGSVGHYLVREHICAEISTLTQELCKAMDKSMQSVLEPLIVSRVTAYRQLYTVPRQKVARQDAMLRPLQERQKNIHIQLRAILPRL